MKVSSPPPQQVDARGFACPLPIVMLARALKAHHDVELLADDPAARADLEAFCGSTGCALVKVSQEGPVLRALVRRGA